MKNNDYFKIFANCLVVNGISRSLIIDIQRQYYTTIPDTMSEVISLFKNKNSIKQVYEIYGNENIAIIN